MDFLSALFMATGIWFWVSIAVLSIIFFWCLEKEQYFGLFLGSVAMVFAVEYLTTAALFTWVLANPWTLVYCLMGYFTIGVAWAVGKWWFFVHARRREYDEVKRRFLVKHGVLYEHDEGSIVVPEELREQWKEAIERHGEYRIAGHRQSFPPHPRNYKAKISGWIAWWPWSALWTLLNDPLRRMAEWIYYRVAALLRRISEQAFAGTEDDFKMPEKETAKQLSRRLASEGKDYRI